MNHVDKSKGFTLVELMLAMSFIGVLLVAIALTVIQISNIYNRGLTLKDVNQVGITITSDLQSSINQSSPFSLAADSPNYVQQSDWGGRLCLGQYSYIWNYAKALGNDATNLNTYVATKTPINFVRVLDPGASYCVKPYKQIDSTNSVDLLNGSDHNLALHAFSITSTATATDSRSSQQLYSINFQIGTNDQNAIIYNTTNKEFECKPPGLLGADFTYCSVTSFDIIARAGSGVE